MKKIMSSIVVLLAVFIIPFQASAHVSVLPSESTVDSWETYTMKVPSEKDAASKKIVLKVTKGVSFESYEPVPGWTTTIDKKNGTVTWQTEGSGIEKVNFSDLVLLLKIQVKKEKSLGMPINIMKMVPSSNGLGQKILKHHMLQQKSSKSLLNQQLARTER